MKLSTHVASLSILSAAAVAALGLVPTSAQAQVTEIVLANPEALTGAASSIGRPLAAGYELAARQIAADGGFEVAGKKYKFKIMQEDYASAPDRGVIATQKLISQTGAKIVLGPNLSLALVPAAEILAREKVLAISAALTMDRFIGQPGKELFFKLAPNEIVRAGGLTRALQQAFPAVKTIAILLPGDDLGRQHHAIFLKEFDKIGFKVVYDEFFPIDATDYASQLTAIREKKPDALFIGYLDKHVGTITKQAVQLGLSKIFLAAPGPSGDPGYALQNEPGFGYVWSIVTRTLADTTDPKLEKFKADYEKFLGRKPDQPNDFYGLHTHDAVMILAAAMQKAGTVTDIPKIANTMIGLKDYSHSVLDMFFDDKHQTVFVQSVGIIKDGKESYVLGK
jgi:branched-chain amino acid transport system substrate-binding protein